MSNDLTVGHTEFTPYDKNFDVDVYLNDLNKKMKESDVDELMADVTLNNKKLDVINSDLIKDMDLSKHCGSIVIDTMNQEAILHVHMKNLKVINAKENKEE